MKCERVCMWCGVCACTYIPKPPPLLFLTNPPTHTHRPLPHGGLRVRGPARAEGAAVVGPHRRHDGAAPQGLGCVRVPCVCQCVCVVNVCVVSACVRLVWMWQSARPSFLHEEKKEVGGAPQKLHSISHSTLLPYLSHHHPQQHPQRHQASWWSSATTGAAPAGGCSSRRPSALPWARWRCGTRRTWCSCWCVRAV